MCYVCVYQTCSGIQLHMVEIYLPELLTVAANAVCILVCSHLLSVVCVMSLNTILLRQVPAQCSLRLLQPCCQLLANTKEYVTSIYMSTSLKLPSPPSPSPPFTPLSPLLVSHSTPLVPLNYDPHIPLHSLHQSTDSTGDREQCTGTVGSGKESSKAQCESIHF